MANAIQWIAREAKRLRRAHPKKYNHLANPWRDGYMAEASDAYNRKHKGKSSSGKKRVKKPARKPAKRSRRKVSNVTTASRSHTDRNRITANIQIGSIQSHKTAIRHKLKTNLGKQLLAREMATKKSVKKKHSKKIAEIKKEIRHFC